MTNQTPLHHCIFFASVMTASITNLSLGLMAFNSSGVEMGTVFAYANLIALLCGVALGTAMYRGDRRVAQLEVAAAALGWRFEARTNLSEHLDNAIRGTRLSRTGAFSSCRNLSTGEIDDLRVRVFDYEYEGCVNGHDVPVSTTVAMFLTDQLPAFSLLPTTWLQRLGGRSDQDLIGLPDSKRTPQVRDAFTAAPGWAVESTGSALIVYRPKHPASAADLGAFASQANDLARALGVRPDYRTTRRRGGRTTFASTAQVTSHLRSCLPIGVN